MAEKKAQRLQPTPQSTQLERIEKLLAESIQRSKHVEAQIDHVLALLTGMKETTPAPAPVPADNVPEPNV